MRPRTILAVAFLASVTLVPRCASGTRISPPPAMEPARVSDPFQTTIRPILSKRCGACHDPGGKMYARLPFDDPHVVASHNEGVLRRLNGDDREAMLRWIAGLAPAATQR